LSNIGRIGEYKLRIKNYELIIGKKGIKIAQDI